jgi:UDP-3-O-[3-hydroxymyristoyl] glucosamine N-acyltransferase
MHGVQLGDRVILHAGVVIGADGFGIAFAADANSGGHWEKVPQLGGVKLGNDCEIGANSCIDRGAIDDTILEDDVRVDNLVQIGHNVRIGAHTAIAGTTAIAGSARIGRYCMLAGRSGVGCGCANSVGSRSTARDREGPSAVTAGRAVAVVSADVSSLTGCVERTGCGRARHAVGSSAHRRTVTDRIRRVSPSFPRRRKIVIVRRG